MARMENSNVDQAVRCRKAIVETDKYGNQTFDKAEKNGALTYAARTARPFAIPSPMVKPKCDGDVDSLPLMLTIQLDIANYPEATKWRVQARVAVTYTGT